MWLWLQRDGPIPPLALRPTVINAHFVWAAAAGTVCPRIGWTARQSLRLRVAGPGAAGNSLLVRPRWWAEPRHSRHDTRLCASLSPLVAPGDQSATPRLAENTTAYTCRSLFVHRGGGARGKRLKRYRTAVCHAQVLGELRAGPVRLESTVNTSQRAGTVQFNLFSLSKRRFCERNETWWCVMLWGCASGNTHVRARTPRHTFLQRGSRVGHWVLLRGLMLSINNALCVTFLNNGNGVEVFSLVEQALLLIDCFFLIF